MAIARTAEGLIGEGNGLPATAPQETPATAATVGPKAKAKPADVVVKAGARSGDTVAIAVATGPAPETDRIEKLAAMISSAPAGTPKNVQKELARSARLLPRLRAPSNRDLIDEVAISVHALLLDPPNLDLAKQANDGVGRDLRFRTYTPATRMLVGVAILSYFFAFGWLLAGGKILDLEISMLVGPAVFGWLGSVASIVTRINNFRNVANPLTVGATRPVLGSAFGIFTYLALTSGIVTFSTTPSPQFYLAIAFIAGFSEQFVPDLISQFESDNKRSQDGATDTVTAQAEVRP